jgi:hypothetical protein
MLPKRYSDPHKVATNFSALKQMQRKMMVRCKKIKLTEQILDSLLVLQDKIEISSATDTRSLPCYFSTEQCCGSGMFDPGSDHFLIPDPGSKHFFIPDPT